MTGAFITFEGGDGAGKTTQAALLEKWLIGRGHSVVRTREPGGTDLGVKIRNILLHGDETVFDKAEALLYAADRAQHVSALVRPALSAGKIVVQDRYIDSSLAYQGAGRVLETDQVRDLNEWATDGLWPDLTILLDLEPGLAAARRSDRGSDSDRIEREKLDFHAAVREGFLKLAKDNLDRTLICDAKLPEDQIALQIQERIKKQLSL
ncbi:MAG TPA: dTMP kinase [Microbacteriaceae bacterium]|nr:dTMP kinase [Microbacteriaceae bacterium]